MPSYVDLLTQPLNQQVIKYFATRPDDALNHPVSQTTALPSEVMPSLLGY